MYYSGHKENIQLNSIDLIKSTVIFVSFLACSHKKKVNCGLKTIKYTIKENLIDYLLHFTTFMMLYIIIDQ